MSTEPEELDLKRWRTGLLAIGPAAAVVADLLLLLLLPMHPAVAVAMSVISGGVLARRRWPRTHSPVAVLLGILYLLAAVTLLLPLDIAAGLRWGKAVIVVIALFLPAAAATQEERLRICRFLVRLAAAFSVYAAVEIAFDLPAIWGPPPRNGQGEIIWTGNEILIGSGLGRAEVTLVRPLLLSFLTLVALTLAFRRDVLPRRRLPLIGVLLIGLLASGSRSAAAVAVLLFLSVSVRSPRPRLVITAIGAVGAIGVALSVALLRPDLVERVLANPSVAHRLEGIRAAIGLVDDQAWWRSLLGNGYGQVLRLFEEGRLQSDGFHAVDNQFAYTFAELGVAGLVVLGWLLWRAFTRTDGLTTLPLATAVIMFLSFDVLANASSLGLFVVLLGLVRRRAPDGSAAESAQGAPWESTFGEAPIRSAGPTAPADRSGGGGEPARERGP
jgi:hypothetical protein